mmetsp:Transcript_32688/g.56991  ORF Transcript_32688/g.56991 Transcript_32688/m.56991 type:complete len:380 (-) Transcript_32688:48-1187(-)
MTMHRAYALERKLAISTARTAAKLCERVRQQINNHQQQQTAPAANDDVITKIDQSPVTVADFGAQAVICRALEATFPNDPVVAEEDASELRTGGMADRLDEVTRYVQGAIDSDDDDTNSNAIVTPTQVANWIDRGNSTEYSERFWTLDPIDGTKGFLRPNGQYAVALSLVEKGEVKVGVLACPAFTMEGCEGDDSSTGWLFVAVQGQGAYRISLAGNDSFSVGEDATEIPLQVCSSNPETTTINSTINNNPATTMRFVESVEASHGDQRRQCQIAKAVGITSDNSLRMDSQAKYAAVAAGSAALYLRLPSPEQPDRKECIWDHAAGVVIVEEAGGKVTDMRGEKLDVTKGARLENNRGVVCSSGFLLHEKVIEALKHVC